MRKSKLRTVRMHVGSGRQRTDGRRVKGNDANGTLPNVGLSSNLNLSSSSDDDRPNYVPRVTRQRPQTDTLYFTANELRTLNLRSVDVVPESIDTTFSSDVPSPATHREGGWPASFRPGDCYGLDVREPKRRRLGHATANGKLNTLPCESPAPVQVGGRRATRRAATTAGRCTLRSVLSSESSSCE